MKTNKYSYLYILQGYYQGWEDLTFSDTMKDAKSDKKDYVANEKGSYRIIKRREPNQ